MSALLRVSLLLQVVSCQGLLHIHVAPAPGPVIAGCLEETVATCVVRGAGPPIEISWRTGGLPYTAELQTTQENGTMTIRSELKMIPNNGIYGLSVTCVIVQNLGVNEEQFEKTIALQNIHFAPDIVNIDLLSHEPLQLLCNSHAHPAAEYTWWRDDQVITSGDAAMTPKNTEPGMYKCEAKNYLGAKTATLKIENTFL